MTPDEALAAVAFQERDLQLMRETAMPALDSLQRVADGDRSMTRQELRKAKFGLTGSTAARPTPRVLDGADHLSRDHHLRE